MEMKFHNATHRDRLQSNLQKFYLWLTRPTDPSSLGLFRIFYGYIVIMQLSLWADMFKQFQSTVYTLHYPGLSWIKPVSPAVGNLMLLVCFLSAVCITIGFMTRVASVVNFVIFGYLFHICHSFFNNHYVLMCHINFIGCFINWGTWASIDLLLKKRRKQRIEKTIPYWHLLLMQLIFCVPYFWGSVAKMNSDWMFRAQPLIMWFSARDAWIFKQWWFPWFVAWSGCVYDLIISFLLFWKKTRFILAFPMAITFNCSNKLIFNIGVFPYAMMASLILFLDPDEPYKWYETMAIPPEERPDRRQETDLFPDKDDEKTHRHIAGRKWHKFYVLTFVISFISFHSLYPVRHFFLYKSNPSWTEEGHTGAWHMKLRSKRGWVYLEFKLENEEVLTLHPQLDKLVTKKLFPKINSRPEDLLTYADRLKQIVEAAGMKVTAINAISCYSLNNNPPCRLYIPDANLVDYIGKNEWIGISGTDKWIYAFEDAPSCDLSYPLSQDKLEIEDTFESVFAAARIMTAGSLGLADRPKRYVYHVRKGVNLTDVTDSDLQPAYLWNV